MEFIIVIIIFFIIMDIITIICQYYLESTVCLLIIIVVVVRQLRAHLYQRDLILILHLTINFITLFTNFVSVGMFFLLFIIIIIITPSELSTLDALQCSPGDTAALLTELPYFCPRCGDKFRFSSVPDLRAHLVSRHTYETLLVLSKARVRSSRSGALLPLPGPGVSQRRSSSLGMEPPGLPSPLACLDLATSAASVRMLREMFYSSNRGLPMAAITPEGPSSTLALCGSLELLTRDKLSEQGVRLGLEFGFYPVSVGLEERLGLGLERKITWMFTEVEERVNQRVAHLRAELQKREAKLEQERRDRERLRSEKQEVEERAAYLSRQVSAAMAMMEGLQKNLEGRERELGERQQEMVDIECFLRETAEREAEAKARLQIFIETLLERAERAERHLLLLSSHTHLTHTLGYTPAPGRSGRSLDSSTDDIVTNKAKETLGYRRSHSVSSSDKLLGDQLCSRHHYRVVDEDWGRTWSKRSLRHHSTEEEEEEEEEEDLWDNTKMRRLVFTRIHTPGTGSSSSPHSTLSRRHGNSGLGADTLRLRAVLFCAFPYLDVDSLLCAAEVCSDWRFVARHPAVWTRLRLENARVSAKFLCTLSQWCTQTQSLALNNLKPRNRRADETPEDYHRDTRGTMEVGVEALLRSAGGSLLHLSVSQCPHILTDRTLWLASCYCRNLHTLIYRSSSDPICQEVLWALGAGCRNISSLQVAPTYPCQQPTRFGNRCLQTIGRCWPHLCSLSVGGAGCGIQGLVAVVRSCVHLQELELERITDLGLQAATELCGMGLRSLRKLILTRTPVSGQAVLHFHSVCPELRCIVVKVSATDYFEEPNTQEAQHLFGEILNTLKVLQKRAGLCDILQVNVE
ncbi:F-box only protein 41-like [Genypterus blacodes]|uniref:F-box only protein 41-like n=1 Tax=Genypterus blacodes TaxID=154954 RepID=UPI003F76E6F5